MTNKRPFDKNQQKRTYVRRKTGTNENRSFSRCIERKGCFIEHLFGAIVPICPLLSPFCPRKIPISGKVGTARFSRCIEKNTWFWWNLLSPVNFLTIPFFPMHREKHDLSPFRAYSYIYFLFLLFLSIYRYIEWGQKRDKNLCFSRCIEKNTLSVLSPAKGQKQPFFPMHREKQDGDKIPICSNLRGQMGTNHCFSRCIERIAGTKYIACYGFLTLSTGLVKVNL